jgi:hypothetical protein
VLNGGVIALACAFMFLAVLLASVMPGPAWSWRAKLAGVAASALLVLATLASVPGLLGWPSDAALPPRFRLLAVQVLQPDKQTRHEGAVFLWAVDAKDLTRAAEPRAFRLPYSEALHESAATAAAKLGKGVAQLGEFDARGTRRWDWLEAPGMEAQAPVLPKFYDVPDPLYPEG